MASLSPLSTRVQASPRQRRGISAPDRGSWGGGGGELEGDFSKARDKEEENKEKENYI